LIQHFENLSTLIITRKTDIRNARKRNVTSLSLNGAESAIQKKLIKLTKYQNEFVAAYPAFPIKNKCLYMVGIVKKEGYPLLYLRALKIRAYSSLQSSWTCAQIAPTINKISLKSCQYNEQPAIKPSKLLCVICIENKTEKASGLP
jgi:hypothetical protein